MTRENTEPERIRKITQRMSVALLETASPIQRAILEGQVITHSKINELVQVTNEQSVLIAEAHLKARTNYKDILEVKQGMALEKAEARGRIDAMGWVGKVGWVVTGSIISVVVAGLGVGVWILVRVVAYYPAGK